MLTSRLAPLLALALAAFPACTPRREATGADTAVSDLRADEARLQGSWRLVNYSPEEPLEPVFAVLLTAQINTMTIRFENGKMLAQSPSIDLIRNYRIENAAGPRFELVAFDEQNVAYRSSCELAFDGKTVTFRGTTAPWRGVGTLQRISN